MKLETAQKIQECTQRGIKELNQMLTQVQGEISEEEFSSLKRSVAQAMGRLIDIEHACVYKEHPSLKPY